MGRRLQQRRETKEDKVYLMRTIIVGGPQCGKSTYANSLSVPHFCGDPKSLVKYPLPNVTYLPEGLTWSQGSEYIAKNWFTMPGPWVIEGVSVARALRKWSQKAPYSLPADSIIYFTNAHPSVVRSVGQDAMEKGVHTIWGEVASLYKSITKYHTWK